jgi:hypothetical protein
VLINPIPKLNIFPRKEEKEFPATIHAGGQTYKVIEDDSANGSFSV